MALSEEHRAYLNSNAITDDVISTTGLHTDENSGLLCFPWVSATGTTTTQTKRVVEGEKTGYLWTAGAPLHEWQLRELGDDGPVLVVEGTKQSLAALSWAPEEYSVYGMAGCRGLSKVDLEFAEERDVFIILDADAASNADVYEAGENLRTRFTDEGARVRFVRLPVDAEDKAGLDDYLASIKPEKRTQRFVRRIAEAAVRPADRKPARSGKKRADDVDMPDTGGREMVAVNGDLKTVTDNIIGALKSRWDGHYLFNYGRALTCLEGPATLPLEDGAFLRLLAETVMMVVHKPATARAPEQFIPGGRPDSQTVKAVMSSVKDFTELNRVVRAPFVRADGTICLTPGYDPSTKTVLIDDPSFAGLSVPDSPSDSERAEALSLLLDDWLSDMPFPTEGSRANALALIITPFVRGLFDLVPLAVINGLQMGVGKNLFADCVAMLSTGAWAVPMPYTQDDDETRKQITSAFRSGMELFAFDEAHIIQGTALARALTSVTYADRILGASHMAEFPNTVTWMSMGNNVSVNGDCSRRVYWIDLKPAGANPQDRDASCFRHPDLKGWTEQNRIRLMSAVLTLVRAWFAAGQPLAPRGTTLGSYEKWDKVVGGIVSHAGVQGFLSEIQAKRSETDFDGAFWLAHIQWLREEFGRDLFTTAEVRGRAVNDPKGYEAPPRMEDVSDKGYPRVLGQRYAQKADRWYGDLRLVKAGLGHRSTIRWQVEKRGDGPEERRLEGTGGTGLPLHMEKNMSSHSVSTYQASCDNVFTNIEGGAVNPVPPSVPSEDVVKTDIVEAFDLETCSVDELFRRPDFCRLGASTSVRPTGDMQEVIRSLQAARRVTGHNILAFDLIALARWHGADYEALAAKSFDTLIAARQLDPPLSKGMPTGHYHLDQVAARLGVAGKTDDIKALARKHGGFDQIPLDDPDYVSYLEGDVKASEGVCEALLESADADPYIAREHAVQTILGRVMINGFAVDEEYTRERYDAGQRRLEAIRERLHRNHGFPAEGKAPQRSNAGKAALYEALRASGLGPNWIDREWPNNKDGTLSLSKEVLQEKLKVLSGPKPEAAGICEAILEMNGVRTVYGNVLDWTVDGRVHPQISPEQASGRWSITKPGLTVLGKRGGKVVERGCLTADPGELLICFDADQVDMRVIAGHCQDPAYMKLFMPGPNGEKPDPHTDIARMLGLTREQSKACGHGEGYGMQVSGMVNNGVAPDVAEKYMRMMSETFPIRISWRDGVRDIAGAGELLDNGFGRKMRVHPESAFTQAPAFMGQGGTRDIMAQALLNLPAELQRRVKCLVHDEVVMSVPADSVEDVKRLFFEAATFEFKGVPITWGASKAAFRWSDCY